MAEVVADLNAGGFCIHIRCPFRDHQSGFAVARYFRCWQVLILDFAGTIWLFLVYRYSGPQTYPQQYCRSSGLHHFMPITRPFFGIGNLLSSNTMVVSASSFVYGATGPTRISPVCQLPVKLQLFSYRQRLIHCRHITKDFPAKQSILIHIQPILFSSTISSGFTTASCNRDNSICRSGFSCKQLNSLHFRCRQFLIYIQQKKNVS